MGLLARGKQENTVSRRLCEARTPLTPGCEFATGILQNARFGCRASLCAFSVHLIRAYPHHAVFGTTNDRGWSMIDPKANLTVLQTLQEVVTSAADMAEAQRQRLSHVFGAWKEPHDLRVQVALVALEDRRMAARRKILAELD